MSASMQCEKCFRSCRLSKSGKTWICTICKHREKANGGQAVRNTPRTDDQECDMFVGISTFTSSDIQQAFDFARTLERELNAANDRIKRLENIIFRASTSFFEDGSDRVVAVAMLMILDEAKEAKP